MSKSIPISKKIIIANNKDNKESKTSINDSIKKNFQLENSKFIENDEITLNTTMSMTSIDLTKGDKKEGIERNGIRKKNRKNLKKVKVNFIDKIEIIDVDNYKEYNKMTSPGILYEALSDFHISCGSGSCIII